MGITPRNLILSSLLTCQNLLYVSPRSLMEVPTEKIPAIENIGENPILHEQRMKKCQDVVLEQQRTESSEDSV